MSNETLTALPAEIATALKPLFNALSLDEAMPRLVPTERAKESIYKLAEEAAVDPALAERPELLAGVWLYVDDLDRSHEFSQGIKGETGAMWHAIMHRREGDFSNSRYWLGQVGRHHPAFAALRGYDPQNFLSAVTRGHEKNPSELVEMQRMEWAALFGWCSQEQR